MVVLWPNGSTNIPRVSSEFGMRFHPVAHVWRLHAGIDLVGFSTIKSPVDGVVTFAAYNGGAGNEVRIRANNGDVFRLMHNKSFLIRQGQRVSQGQSVAIMGTTGSSTGVHCHEETRPGGGAAINPRDYYAKANARPSGGGSKPTPAPTKKRRKQMSTGVIHTDEPSTQDSKRSGAIVNTESGLFSPFGWFPVSYANGIAKGFGLEASAPVTRGSYNQIRSDMAALRKANGNLAVDIADEDVPKVGG